MKRSTRESETILTLRTDGPHLAPGNALANRADDGRRACAVQARCSSGLLALICARADQPEEFGPDPYKAGHTGPTLSVPTLAQLSRITRCGSNTVRCGGLSGNFIRSSKA